MGDPTVNRLQELASFIKLLDLACSSESRVLVIEEASGRGKSRLIQRFKEVCYERAAALSSVDLVGGSLSPIDILKRMAHDLEDIRFERCWNVLNKRGVANLQVGIEGNKILGSATLNVDSPVYVERATREEQKQFWSDAAQEFQQDLRECRRVDSRAIVMFFDTYEKAAPESQAWICDHLLPAVAPKRVAGLLIVVAGKSCPRPSGEWEDQCQSLALHSLKKEDWVQYATLVGSMITEEQIQMLYDKHEGATLKMAEAVGLFIP